MSDQSKPSPPENRPLCGVRVLVTRPQREAKSLAKRLEMLGGQAILHPVIRISEAPDPDRLKHALGRLNEFSLVAMLSRNAAVAFDEQFQRSTSKPMPPIAAIGIGTKEILLQSGYEVSCIPKESNSRSMAELLIEQHKQLGPGEESKPILILRADRGSDILPNALAQANVPFEELAVYQSEDVATADPVVLKSLADGRIDWVTVTSSAIAHNVARLFAGCLGKSKIASISPTTTQAAIEAGLTVAAEATAYNMDGLIAAIVDSQSDS